MAKSAVASKRKAESSSDSSSSSSSEDEKPVVRKTVNKKKVESSSDSSSDSSSEDEKPVKKAPVKKAPAKKAASSSDSDSSSEDEKPVKRAPAKKAASSSDSDSSSEDEKPVKKAPVKKAPAKKAASSSDSDSSSEDEKPVKRAPAKKAASSSDSDSSDSDSSSEDEKPVKKAPVKKVAESTSASSSDSSSDSDSDSDSSEDTAPKAGAKRVRDAEEEAPASKSSKSEGTSVFVKGFPFTTTEDDIRQMFAPCGTISELYCLTFEDTGRFRGMARITFANAAAAEKAVGLNNTDVGGRYISVEINKDMPGKDKNAPPAKPASEPSTTLFMGNLSFQVTEDDIRAAFADCGEIVSVRIATDKESGRPRGFGHLEFATIDDAKKAMEQNGCDVAGRSIKMDYAAARTGGGDRPSFGGRSFGGDRGRPSFGRGGRGGRGGFGGAPQRASSNIKPFEGKKMTF